MTNCSSGSCPAQPPPITGAGSCCNPSQGLTLFDRFLINGGYVITGIGTRNSGAGTINLTLPANTVVVAAYLYWDVYCYNSIQADTIYYNGQNITGLCLGVGPYTHWANFSNSPNICNQPTSSDMQGDINNHNRVYWADVTGLTSATGNYSVSGLPYTATDPCGNPIGPLYNGDTFTPPDNTQYPGFAGSNGVALLVIYQNQNPDLSCTGVQEIQIWHGLVVLGIDVNQGQLPDYSVVVETEMTGNPSLGFAFGDGGSLEMHSTWNGASIDSFPAPSGNGDWSTFNTMEAGGGNGAALWANTLYPVQPLPTQVNIIPPLTARNNNILTVNSANVPDGFCWFLFVYSGTNCRCKIHVQLISDGPGFEIATGTAYSLGCQTVDVSVIDSCGALGNPPVLLQKNFSGPWLVPPIAVVLGDAVDIQLQYSSSSYTICQSSGPNCYSTNTQQNLNPQGLGIGTPGFGTTSML